MTLATLTIERVVIPFRTGFRHAAAARHTTESVWVTARSRDGIVGHGEGCPRRYVTGEDFDTVRAFFARHRARLLEEITDVGELIQWVDRHRDDIDRNPAAWCALELALLDVLARDQGRSVEAILGLQEVDGTYRFSAVVGIEDTRGFQAIVGRYRGLGFDDFKVKLSGNRARDGEHVAWLQSELAGCGRMRLDANNLWRSVDEAVDYIAAMACPVFAIEEPLVPNQYRALCEVASRTRTRIVLDESLLRPAQLRTIAVLGRDWVVNLRVSKMGGMLRSLEIAAAARLYGIPLVVGAHVGETSLLTRAALTVARQTHDVLIAQEGAFGTHLLTSDVGSSRVDLQACKLEYSIVSPK